MAGTISRLFEEAEALDHPVPVNGMLPDDLLFDGGQRARLVQDGRRDPCLPDVVEEGAALQAAEGPPVPEPEGVGQDGGIRGHEAGVPFGLFPPGRGREKPDQPGIEVGFVPVRTGSAEPRAALGNEVLGSRGPGRRGNVEAGPGTVHVHENEAFFPFHVLVRGPLSARGIRTLRRS
jgi:hypothetical protein